jgi:uncharacterized lipoprotein YehR (DUF1307 family)
MKQLRKFLPVMLVMVLALGLFGCGSSSSEEEEPAAADTSASTSEEAEAAEESAEISDCCKSSCGDTEFCFHILFSF